MTQAKRTAPDTTLTPRRSELDSVARKERWELHRWVVDARARDEMAVQIAQRYAAKSVSRMPSHNLGEVLYEDIAAELCCLQVKQHPAAITQKEEQAQLRVISSAGSRAEFASSLRSRRPIFFERAPLYRLTNKLGDRLLRKKLINSIERHVRRFLLATEARDPSAELSVRLSCRPRVLTRRAIYLLAVEGLRDPVTLRLFLDSLFEHFHKIYDPFGVHRHSVVLHQIAERFRNRRGEYNWEKLCAYLETIGAMPKRQKGDSTESLRKMLSRERANAAKQVTPAHSSLT